MSWEFIFEDKSLFKISKNNNTYLLYAMSSQNYNSGLYHSEKQRPLVLGVTRYFCNALCNIIT